MTLRRGAAYELDGVRIGAPDPEAVRAAPLDADVAASVHHWLSRAEGAADVHSFAVYEGGALVGQIFLHDIDPGPGEALVGYHLFERRFRGRGTGTRMLTLLQRFVREETALRRLVVITGEDNVASQRAALRCGFVPAGRPREDPVHGRCFAWRVPGGAAGDIGTGGVLHDVRDYHTLEVIRDAEGFPGVFSWGPVRFIRRALQAWGSAAAA